MGYAVLQQDKSGPEISVTRKEKVSGFVKLELGPVKAVHLGSLKDVGTKSNGSSLRS